MTRAVRYAIGDLAQLAGVSRRTVRYYVQEKLITAPLGVGRGDHYGPEHLEQIRRLKAMQETGKTLDEIRGQVMGGARPRGLVLPEIELRAPERSTWRRLTLAAGVELQIRDDLPMPSTRRIEELAAWCRLHVTSISDSEAEGGDA